MATKRAIVEQSTAERLHSRRSVRAGHGTDEPPTDIVLGHQIASPVLDVLEELRDLLLSGELGIRDVASAVKVVG